MKQSNLFSNISEYETPKEVIFSQIINDLKESKTTFVVKNTKFIIYHYGEILKDVHVLALAREEKQKIPVEGKFRIEEEPILKTPFVYVIVDNKRQIILVQEKTTVFQDIEVAVNRLLFYFTSNFRQHFITPSIIPITDKKEFWQVVEQSEGITEFDITLNSPNLFKGRQKAEDLVEEIHEEFNATQFEIKLKNNFGKLKLLYENAKDFVSLAASGAGKYVLKTIQNGIEVVLKSSEFIKKKNYDVHNPLDINTNQIENDLNELDKLNDETNNENI